MLGMLKHARKNQRHTQSVANASYQQHSMARQLVPFKLYTIEPVRRATGFSDSSHSTLLRLLLRINEDEPPVQTCRGYADIRICNHASGGSGGLFGRHGPNGRHIRHGYGGHGYAACKCHAFEST